MQSMTEFLNIQPAWHWWALGAVLLALEIASTTQYLLWPGIAALLVGLLKTIDPSLDGRLAVFLFAVLSVVATIVWKRSRWGSAAKARRRFSRRRRSEASSNGDSAVGSSTRSPSEESSSSPTGFSSETGCCAIRHTSRTSRTAICNSAAISAAVGSRPSSCTSWRSAWTTRLSFSTMWTGIRIVRPLSAIARVTAWRIHHVA